MEDIFVNGDIFLLCNREKTLQAEPARIRCASSCCGLSPNKSNNKPCPFGIRYATSSWTAGAVY